MMDVEIIRIGRKRKYMVLRLMKDGTFSLRVSIYVTGTQIDSFLDKNGEWMDRVKEKFDRDSQMKESVKFEDGEKRPLFWVEYEIQIAKGRRCLHLTVLSIFLKTAGIREDKCSGTITEMN
ncbi:hypothetical protein ACNF40_05215 [Cuniculiplasma sp. SKW4]|uniref:hypothetical protein n=1 Tax=Cuniculiplasma sp. SKW4 TaxID=3400171 RepID=UPI003FCFF95D